MSALKTSQKQSRRWHPLKRSRILARATFPDFIERDGEKFFQTGRLIANTLEQFSKSLQTARFSNMEQFYSSNFSGNSLDRKSTRLNSSHANISYAVFCL